MGGNVLLQSWVAGETPCALLLFLVILSQSSKDPEPSATSFPAIQASSKHGDQFYNVMGFCMDVLGLTLVFPAPLCILLFFLGRQYLYLV